MREHENWRGSQGENGLVGALVLGFRSALLSELTHGYAGIVHRHLRVTVQLSSNSSTASMFMGLAGITILASDAVLVIPSALVAESEQV